MHLPRLQCALLFLLATVGCDESDCEKYGDKLCDKACSCTDGPECSFSQGGGVTLTFESKSDCKALFSFGCGSDDDDTDYAACLKALESATCEVGVSGEKVLVHPSCDGSEMVDAGSSGADGGI